MEKPICTVLLITYNHAPYIKKCIDSVLGQKTKYPFIIKIFDDASNDGSSDIVRQYAAKHPKLIEAHIAKTNQGAQANIWSAFKSVDTKYCILTETDDVWCDDSKLDRQIKALEQNPDCSFCAHQSAIHNIGDKYRADEDGMLLVTNPNVLKSQKVSLDDILKLPVLSGYNVSAMSRLIRMSAINLAQIKNKEAFLFDNCQFYYLLLQGKMYFINRTMSTYNQTGSGEFSGQNPHIRAHRYIKAFIEFNEETNYVLGRRVLEETGHYIRYSLGLEHQMHKPAKKRKCAARRALSAVWRIIYQKPRQYLRPIIEKHRGGRSTLLILDNFEPSVLRTGFRVTEFNYLLSNVRGSRLLTFSDDIYKYSDWKKRSASGDIIWNTPKPITQFFADRKKYSQAFPYTKGRLIYLFDKKYNADGAYVMFLYNAYLSYRFFEQNKIPFVFTLFPGGGFCLNQRFSDHMLKCVCQSPMFRGVYCPQMTVYNYLIEKNVCPVDKIFYRYGGGFFQITKKDVLPKQFYPQDKDTFDIGFVAYRYMPKGLDKGYDLFLEAARRIIKKYPFVHFHNVGLNGVFDYEDKYEDIATNMHNYGSKPASFFPEFYAKMDIVLSPNRKNVLRPGAFDGFPMAVEAAYCGTALFVTNPMKAQTEYVNNVDLIEIQPDVNDIVDKIEYYIKNLSELYKISKNGQIKTQKIFDIRKQEQDRREFIEKFLKIKFD